MAPVASRAARTRGASVAASPEPTQALRAVGALALHGGVEAGLVDGPALAAQDVLGQIEREAEGVVELEGDLAARASGPRRAWSVSSVEQLEAAVEGLVEAALLQLEGLGDQRLGAAELAEGLAHERTRAGTRRHIIGLLDAQLVHVAHGPAHDPAQHVAAALVGRQHAVGDQEGGGAQVIGDHPVADDRMFAVGLAAVREPRPRPR